MTAGTVVLVRPQMNYASAGRWRAALFVVACAVSVVSWVSWTGLALGAARMEGWGLGRALLCVAMMATIYSVVAFRTGPKRRLGKDALEALRKRTRRGEFGKLTPGPQKYGWLTADAVIGSDGVWTSVASYETFSIESPYEHTHRVILWRRQALPLRHWLSRISKTGSIVLCGALALWGAVVGFRTFGIRDDALLLLVTGTGSIAWALACELSWKVRGRVSASSGRYSKVPFDVNARRYSRVDLAELLSTHLRPEHSAYED